MTPKETSSMQTRLHQQQGASGGPTKTSSGGSSHANNHDQSGYDLTEFTSDEKLPDVWPEEFPGITRFAPADPVVGLQFDSGDIVLVNNLGNLAPGALIDEMKAMHTIASHLAVEEEQERTRGKILRVLLDD